MRDREPFGYWVEWAATQLRTTGDESDAELVGELLGVSPRTIRHWRHVNNAPPWALRVLMLLVNGIAPAAAETWNGWRFSRIEDRWFLCGPEGSRWLPDDLYRYRDTCDHLRALQARVAPGAQLRWEAAGGGARNVWPGGTAPPWGILERALRSVVDDALRDRDYRAACGP